MNGEAPKKLKGAARKRARREEAAALAAAQRAEKKSKAYDEDGKKGGQNKVGSSTRSRMARGTVTGFCLVAKTGASLRVPADAGSATIWLHTFRPRTGISVCHLYRMLKWKR